MYEDQKFDVVDNILHYVMNVYVDVLAGGCGVDVVCSVLTTNPHDTSGSPSSRWYKNEPPYVL